MSKNMVPGFRIGDAIKSIVEDPDAPKREDYLKPNGSVDYVAFIEAVDRYGLKLYCRRHRIPWDTEKDMPVMYRATAC